MKRKGDDDVLIDADRLCELSGLKRTQLEYLVSLGVVPVAVPAPRRGISRRFLPDTVEIARNAAGLLTQRKDIRARLGLPERKKQRPYKRRAKSAGAKCVVCGHCVAASAVPRCDGVRGLDIRFE